MHDHRLNIFYTVANLNSYSAAARALNITQPTVSFQIRQLESYYGARLIDTQQRRVELTEAGKRVFDYAARIRTLYYEMDCSVNAATHTLAGQINLGSDTGVGEYLLPVIIGDFQKVTPGIDVLLKIKNRKTLLAMLQKEELDLVIVSEADELENRIDRYFISDEMVLIAAANSSYADLQEINPQTFEGIPLILRENGSVGRSLALQALADAGIDTSGVSQKLSFGSSAAIKRAVEIGLGVAIVSRLTVIRDLAEGSLKAIPIKNMNIQRKYSFVYKHNYFKEVLLRKFIGFARTYTITSQNEFEGNNC